MNDYEHMVETSKELDAAYKRVFKNESEVLEDLEAFCGYEQDAFDNDARRTAYKLGLQAVIRYIHQRVEGKITKHMEVNKDVR